MNSTKTLTVHIKAFNAKGYGVAHDNEGREYWVLGAIPGEEVEIEVIKKRRKIRFGRIVNFIKKSPYRIDSQEDHYLSCSPWQILNREGERVAKLNELNKLYEWADYLEVTEKDYFDSDIREGYRNKMEFSFYQSDEPSSVEGEVKGRIDIAFHKRDTKSGMIPIDSCILTPQSVQEVVKGVIRILNEQNITKRQLKTLVTRFSDAGKSIYVTLYTKDSEIKFDTGKFNEIPNLTSFSIIYSDPRSPASVTTEVLIPHKNEALQDRINILQFQYHYDGFFQVNIPVFELAVNEMRRYIEQNQMRFKKVVDLYAGVGTIGLLLAEFSEEIVGVELYENAEKYALINAKANGIKNYKFISSSADDITAEALQNAELLIIDPPRAGCSDTVIEMIKTAQPQKLFYLSCNPATQSADLQKLSDLYKIETLQAFNFFPMTPHLESLAICSLK